MLSRIKFEITPLVNEILDQLPASTWLSTTSTFLDPAIAGGQFVREIERRLRAAGHSDENIHSRVFGVEQFPHQVAYAVNKYGLKGQYVVGDFLSMVFSMKFDNIVGNPPFNGKAALHQQFFNKGVDLLIDGGIIAFVQPATMYFNKKDNQKKAVLEMQEKITSNHCEVTFKHSQVFENAGIQNDLSITILTKKSSSAYINKITYKTGDVYNDVPLSDITLTQLDPKIYASIWKKFTKSVTINGSLQDIVTDDTTILKAYIAKIRGHWPSDADFYTLLPIEANRQNYGPSITADYGLIARSNKQVKNIYSYLESNVARFGLALLKFNMHLENGELKLIPLVDFNKTYTNEELYNYVGLTREEILAIENVLKTA